MKFIDIKNNEEINTYIKEADSYLKAIGFTEHSFAHVNIVASCAERILRALNYDEYTIELTKIASYMHDIGNVINRIDHAQSGAIMTFRILDKLGMPTKDIALIVSAIGNHDEATSIPFNAISSALILADKTDVRRSRVRESDIHSFDIHDRVNYAVIRNDIDINVNEKYLKLILDIDTTICPIIEYFEIFMERMLLCKRACNFFHLSFKLEVNGQVLL